MTTQSHTMEALEPSHTQGGLCAVVIAGCGGREVYRLHDLKPMRATEMRAAVNAHCALVDALREIIAINDEDQGTFRKRGGTRRGLSIVAARAALAKVSQ